MIFRLFLLITIFDGNKRMKLDGIRRIVESDGGMLLTADIAAAGN